MVKARGISKRETTKMPKLLNEFTFLTISLLLTIDVSGCYGDGFGAMSSDLSVTANATSNIDTTWSTTTASVSTASDAIALGSLATKATYSSAKSSLSTESSSTMAVVPSAVSQTWNFSIPNITEYACSQLCLPYQACFNLSSTSCICYKDCSNYSAQMNAYPPAKSCKELYYEKEVRMSGIYVIEPDPGHFLKVECDLEGRDLCSGSLVYGMSGTFSKMFFFNSGKIANSLQYSPYDKNSNYLNNSDSIDVSFSNFVVVNGISVISKYNEDIAEFSIIGNYANGSSLWSSVGSTPGINTFTTVQTGNVYDLQPGVRYYFPLKAFVATNVTLRVSTYTSLKFDFHGCNYDPSAEKYIDHTSVKGRYYLPLSNASSMAWGNPTNPNLFDTLIYDTPSGSLLRFHFYDIPLGKVLLKNDAICYSQPLSCNVISKFTSATEQCGVATLQTQINSNYSHHSSSFFNSSECISNYSTIFVNSIIPLIQGYYTACPSNATQFLEDQMNYYYSKVRTSCNQTDSTPSPIPVDYSFSGLCSDICYETDDVNYIPVPIVWVKASYKCDALSYIFAANSQYTFIYDVGPYAEANQTVFSVASTYRIACLCPFYGTKDLQCQPDFTTYAQSLDCSSYNFTCSSNLLPPYNDSSVSKSGNSDSFRVGEKVNFMCMKLDYAFDDLYDVNNVSINCACQQTWSGYYSNSSQAIWTSSYNILSFYSCSAFTTTSTTTSTTTTSTATTSTATTSSTITPVATTTYLATTTSSTTVTVPVITTTTGSIESTTPLVEVEVTTSSVPSSSSSTTTSTSTQTYTTKTGGQGNSLKSDEIIDIETYMHK